MAKKKDTDGIGGSGGSALGLALAGGIGGGVGGGLGGLPFDYFSEKLKESVPPVKHRALKLSVMRNLGRLSGGTLGGITAAVLLDKLSSLREGFANGLEEWDQAARTSTRLPEILKHAQDYYSDQYQAFSPEIMQAQEQQRPSLAAELTLPALVLGGTVGVGVGYPWAKKNILAGWAKLKPKLPRFIGPK